MIRIGNRDMSRDRDKDLEWEREMIRIKEKWTEIGTRTEK